jgi:hypothetical protein
VTFVAPLAAVLGLSVAWAAATGRLLPQTLRALEEGAGVPAKIGASARPQHVAPTAAARAPERPGSPEALPAPIAPPAPVAPVAPSAPRAPDAMPASSARHTSAPAARLARLVASAGVDRDAELYAVAHRAHFTEHEPAAALRGWDAYLAAFPDGRFALEARYNRALSLVRLGRMDDARGALEPFAIGRYGGYRAREARQLIEAMEPGPATLR